MLSSLPSRSWPTIRRILDPVVAFVALVVLSVPSLLLCFVVWAQDRHAPLIGIERVGQGGRIVKMLKIRTMTPSQGGPAITSSNDGRITPVGSLIRRCRIDEIPQLIDVIVGRMALIGPRPEAPDYVDLADQRWQRALSVRPGIAGPTQLVAGVWEATYLASASADQIYREVALPAKLAIDCWYVDNYSARLDALVVVGLFQQMLLGREATRLGDLVLAEVPEARALTVPPSLAKIKHATSCADKGL